MITFSQYQYEKVELVLVVSTRPIINQRSSWMVTMKNEGRSTVAVRVSQLVNSLPIPALLVLHELSHLLWKSYIVTRADETEHMAWHESKRKKTFRIHPLRIVEEEEINQNVTFT